MGYYRAKDNKRRVMEDVDLKYIKDINRIEN